MHLPQTLKQIFASPHRRRIEEINGISVSWREKGYICTPSAQASFRDPGRRMVTRRYGGECKKLVRLFGCDDKF